MTLSTRSWTLALVSSLLSCLACAETTGPVEPEKSRIHGRVWQENDVDFRPNPPYEKGFVLALTAGRWQQSAEAESGRRGFVPSVEFLQSIDATSRIDSGGTYLLELMPGAHVLCLAIPDPQEPGRPGKVRGCVEIETQAGQDLTVDLLYGEGGLRAE